MLRREVRALSKVPAPPNQHGTGLVVDHDVCCLLSSVVRATVVQFRSKTAEGIPEETENDPQVGGPEREVG